MVGVAELMRQTHGPANPGDAQQRENGDDDPQTARGLRLNAVAQNGVEPEHDLDEQQQNGRTGEKDRQHHGDGVDLAVMAHGAGCSQAHGHHRQSEDRHHRRQRVVLGEVELRMHEQPGEVGAENAQGIDAHGEEGGNRARIHPLHHAPQIRHEHSAEDEGDVDGHRQGQRHGHEVDFGVGGQQLFVGVGLAE